MSDAVIVKPNTQDKIENDQNLTHLLSNVLDSTETAESVASARTVNVSAAKDLLLSLLSKENGCVSFKAFNNALENNQLDRSLFHALKAFDFGDSAPLWFHKGRSFYSPESFEQAQATTELKIEKEIEESHEDLTNGESADEPRKNRREEKRFCRYIYDCLNEIYYSDDSPDDVDYVFEISDQRARRSVFTNVDLIAVHWLPHNHVELITVEAKLDFTAQAVHQAINYARFSHRVWVAVPVTGAETQAAMEIREKDPLLFDYVLDMGIGILAGKKGRGGSYNVFPVHWPRLQIPPRLELETFKDAYLDQFMEAEVIHEDRRKPIIPAR